MLGRHAGEQSARGLRVEQQIESPAIRSVGRDAAPSLRFSGRSDEPIPWAASAAAPS
jgi:hypothetical protein